jgi:hypothetical protein
MNRVREKERERECAHTRAHANFKVVIHAFGGTSCMVIDTASLYSDTAEHRNP